MGTAKKVKPSEKNQSVIEVLRKSGIRARLSDEGNLTPYIGKWVYIKYSCPKVECEAIIKILKINDTGIQAITRGDTTKTPVDFFFFAPTRKIKSVQEILKDKIEKLIYQNYD